MTRPKRVTDEQIMRAAWRSLGRLGYAGLTLRAVADDLGVSPPALHKRVKSKRGLLIALGDFMARANQAAVIGGGRPSLAGLRDAFIAAAGPADPVTYANLMSILPEVVQDQELRAKACVRQRTLEQTVATVLKAAVAEGELAATDTDRLSRVMLAACAGAPVLWAQDSTMPVADRIRECLDVLLQPARPDPLTHSEGGVGGG